MGMGLYVCLKAAEVGAGDGKILVGVVGVGEKTLEGDGVVAAAVVGDMGIDERHIQFLAETLASGEDGGVLMEEGDAEVYVLLARYLVGDAAEDNTFEWCGGVGADEGALLHLAAEVHEATESVAHRNVHGGEA